MRLKTLLCPWLQTNERNVQSMMHGLLKLCFNRIREAWRPGGYPPAANAAAPRSSINLRSQEAVQVLDLVDNNRRRQRTFLENADTINWSALALATYREFTTAGFKPTLEVLDKLLMCLRLPLTSSAPSRIAGAGAGAGPTHSSNSSSSGSGGGSGASPLSPGAAIGADAAVARSQELREMAREQENAVGRLAGGYEMPYDKRALDIVGEAINAGLLPGLKVRGWRVGCLRCKSLPPSACCAFSAVPESPASSLTTQHHHLQRCCLPPVTTDQPGPGPNSAVSLVTRHLCHPPAGGSGTGH
jgi:hypothetical protein